VSKRLRRIQRRYRDTALEQLNLDDTWSQWLPIPTETAESSKNLFHLFDVDRFLSIYNRPVRRRQMTHEPGATFPDTGVIRNTVDGSIYLIGADRTDTDGSLAVETLTTLHQVDTVCTIRRRQLADTATEDYPGWLEYVALGDYYFDTELRTVTEESDQASEFVGKYFTFTGFSGLRTNDVIYFPDGLSYIVELPYKDSGFWMARIARLKDTRKDIKIVKIEAVGTTSSTGWNPYDPDGTSGSTAPEEFNVTAWVGSSMSEPMTEMVSTNELRVFIDDFAIGFPPTNSYKLLIDDVEWQITEVKYNYTFDQYRLTCQRV